MGLPATLCPPGPGAVPAVAPPPQSTPRRAPVARPLAPCWTHSLQGFRAFSASQIAHLVGWVQWTSVFTHGPGGRAGAGPETHATRRPVFLGPTSAYTGTPPAPTSPCGAGCPPGVPLSAAPFVLLPVPPKCDTVTGRSRVAQQGLGRRPRLPRARSCHTRRPPPPAPGDSPTGVRWAPCHSRERDTDSVLRGSLTARCASACSLEKPPHPHPGDAKMNGRASSRSTMRPRD